MHATVKSKPCLRIGLTFFLSPSLLRSLYLQPGRRPFLQIKNSQHRRGNKIKEIKSVETTRLRERRTVSEPPTLELCARARVCVCSLRRKQLLNEVRSSPSAAPRLLSLFSLLSLKQLQLRSSYKVPAPPRLAPQLLRSRRNPNRRFAY